MKLEDLWNIPDISRNPSQATQANSHKDELFNPSQAKSCLRSRLSCTVRCSSAALSSDYITRPVALVQHCSSRGAVAEEQHRGVADVQQQQGG